MAPLRVAIVSCDPMVRLQAARAFDSAPASWIVRLFESPPDEADIVVFGPDADPGEGIVFDPAEPDRVLEEVARATSGARFYSITSAQRGVGVTSIALHLAAAAAREHQTCFFDCEGLWGAASRLGLVETPTLDDEDSDEALALAAVPVAGGFRTLLAGRCKVEVGDLLARAGQVFSRVVVDVADDPNREIVLEAANVSVLVTPPTKASALRARELVESCPATRWALVINRVGPGGETTSGEVERIVGRRVALELPCAPALRDAEDASSLLATRLWRWTRRIDDLYRALERA